MILLEVVRELGAGSLVNQPCLTSWGGDSSRSCFDMGSSLLLALLWGRYGGVDLVGVVRS